MTKSLESLLKRLRCLSQNGQVGLDSHSLWVVSLRWRGSCTAQVINLAAFLWMFILEQDEEWMSKSIKLYNKYINVRREGSRSWICYDFSQCRSTVQLSFQLVKMWNKLVFNNQTLTCSRRISLKIIWCCLASINVPKKFQFVWKSKFWSHESIRNFHANVFAARNNASLTYFVQAVQYVFCKLFPGHLLLLQLLRPERDLSCWN